MASGDTLRFLRPLRGANFKYWRGGDFAHSAFDPRDNGAARAHRAQQSLRPEMFARITEKWFFNRLGYDVQLDIARLLLENEMKFLQEKGHELHAECRGNAVSWSNAGFIPGSALVPCGTQLKSWWADAVSNDLLTGGDGER